MTVQLESGTDVQCAEQHRWLADAAHWLIDLMDAHRLPTTWAVSDPAFSAATSLVIRSAVPHELAILGDVNWVGPTAGRTRFARELARRVSQARAAGIDVKSFVPRVASIAQHIDLVIKQQITAIGRSEEATNRPLASPRALHYGLWELPASRVLPLRDASFFFNGEWTTWRRIRATARSGAMFHLVIDAPALLQAGRRAERRIGRLVRRAAELRDRGLLRVETLGIAAARLSDVPALSPQQSILRRAA